MTVNHPNLINVFWDIQPEGFVLADVYVGLSQWCHHNLICCHHVLTSSFNLLSRNHNRLPLTSLLWWCCWIYCAVFIAS